MKIEFNNDSEKIKKITNAIVVIGCICGVLGGLANHNWGQAAGFTMALLAII